MAEIGSQAKVDYFFRNNELSYQAVLQFQKTFTAFLNEIENEVYQFIVDSTARYKRLSSFISVSQFYNGLEPNPETDYAGQMPIRGVSRKALYAAINHLCELGLISKDDRKYTIHLDVTPLDIIQDEGVQKATLHRNRRGGDLSTLEGITLWAQTLTEKLMTAYLSFRQHVARCATSTNASLTQTKEKDAGSVEPSSEPCEPTCSNKPSTSPPKATTGVSISDAQTEPNTQNATTLKATTSLKNKAETVLPYTETHKIEHFPSDKSEGNIGQIIRGYIMGQRTTADVLRSIQTIAGGKRDKVNAKRKARGTLADRCALFEQEWQRGQKEGGASVATRITPRDRALLKSQLLKQIVADFDTADFGFWVARHWQAIGAQYFAKAKSYPASPAMPWLIKCLERYIEAYEQRDLLDESGSLSFKDKAWEAKKANTTAERALQSNAALTDENEYLKGLMAEQEERIRQLEQGVDVPEENLMLDAESLDRIKTNAAKPLPDYDDFDDDGEPIKRKRKLRKRRT